MVKITADSDVTRFISWINESTPDEDAVASVEFVRLLFLRSRINSVVINTIIMLLLQCYYWMAEYNRMAAFHNEITITHYIIH